MGSKFVASGFDELASSFADLAESTERIAGRAVYAGAAVLADAIRQELTRVPSISDSAAIVNASNGVQNTTITEKQKKGLLAGLGTSQIGYKNQIYSIAIGFAGYNEIRTARWPKGQPNVMVARSLESGTTALRKNPVVRKAAKSVESAAIDAADKIILQALNEKMKG